MCATMDTQKRQDKSGRTLCGTWEVRAVDEGMPPAEKGVRPKAVGQAVWIRIEGNE